MSRQEWLTYPPMLTAQHLSVIYGYTLLSTRKMLQQRNPKLPTPCQVRPFRVRREDAMRHFSRLSA